MKRSIRIVFLIVATLSVISILAPWFVSTAAAEQTQIEAVTTIPVETVLKPMGTPSAADVWVEMIDGAKKNIDWACFYLSNKENEPLEPVIRAVLEAAKRGVKVRFLVSTPANDSMARRNKDVIKRFRVQPGIEVVEFNWKSLTGGINHAKYFIVDREELFVGSQNFDWRSLKHIHETGLRIKSPALARVLTRIFEADWQYNKGDKGSYLKMKKEKPLVQGKTGYIVASPPACNPHGVKSAVDVLIKLIDGAKKKITVQLLNYHVDIYRSSEKFTVIDDALRRAAKRGVDVKLLVSDWNKRKPGVNGLKDLVKVAGIRIKFATIPVYSKGFIPYARVIHSKVMRIDDRVSWVGTSNWGKRYFYGSRNVEVVTLQPAVAKTLDRLFEQLWNSSYCCPVEPGKEYQPPRIGK
jgi:phosphatidylserine/phosphatidylglycerophosphate/cardiolipin synthase-like enzyme